MKSILEILGGAQILLGLSFDLQECFEEYLTEEYRGFLAILRVVEEQVRDVKGYRGGRGRPGYGRQSFLRAFLAMRCFRIDTVKALRVRLGGDVNLRRICGFRRVPDAATFSRRLKEFAGSGVLDRVLNGLVRQYQGEGLVGHICRDSTAIEARERPVNCKREVAPPRKRGRGRPRKGESRPEKKERRLARQLSMKSGAALREVEKQCSWGCKNNSQGNVMLWFYRCKKDCIWCLESLFLFRLRDFCNKLNHNIDLHTSLNFPVHTQQKNG